MDVSLSDLQGYVGKSIGPLQQRVHNHLSEPLCSRRQPYSGHPDSNTLRRHDL